MRRIFSIVYAVVLVGVAVFAVFGFMATFEPTDQIVMPWRIGYVLVGAGALLAAAWFLRPRKAPLNDTNGIVWVPPQQLKQGPIRHPPLDEEQRGYIREIQEVFAEHRPLSVEEWEEGFRRDLVPEREIAIFSHAAEVYQVFAANEESSERRQEIYRLLVACIVAPPDAIWRVAGELKVLSRAEAERIAKRFHNGQAARGEP